MSRKDTAKRTGRIVRAYYICCSCMGVIALSLVWILVGTFQFNDVVARSSSPKGTELTFKRSGAKIEISDIYTDKNKSCLIVRFSGSDQDMLKLPYKGTDYQVYVLSSAYAQDKKEASIIFGKMSTDGDMFLIIPSPGDDLYSVFLMNTNYLGSTSSSSSSSSSTSNTTSSGAVKIEQNAVDSSISKSLSGYTYNDRSSTNAGVLDVQDDQYDMVGFRVTTSPAFTNNEAYRAKVIDANLVQSDGTFDFKAMFDCVFKDASLQSLEQDYKETSILNKQELKKRTELTARCALNPNDTTAKSALNTCANNIKKNKDTLDDIGEQMLTYMDLQYSDDLFSNLQTKAKVIKK